MPRTRIAQPNRGRESSGRCRSRAVPGEDTEVIRGAFASATVSAYFACATARIRRYNAPGRISDLGASADGCRGFQKRVDGTHGDASLPHFYHRAVERSSTGSRPCSCSDFSGWHGRPAVAGGNTHHLRSPIAQFHRRRAGICVGLAGSTNRFWRWNRCLARSSSKTGGTPVPTVQCQNPLEQPA